MNYKTPKWYNFKIRCIELFDIYFRPNKYIERCQQIDFMHEYDYGHCNCKDCIKRKGDK